MPGPGPRSREPRPNLGDLAYERFIEALFSRRIRPGAFLSQSDLVAILEVPVGPVRDALRVLQSEGLVAVRARSGIEVVKPDFALARHTYQIRGILERTAVRVYAETAPLEAVHAQIERHRAMLERLDGDPSEADIRALESLDHGLHMEVIDSLRNPLVVDTYRRIHSFLNLIILERGFSRSLMVRTLNEHLEILEACRRRDPDAAEAALERHFDRALQRAMGLF